MPGTALAFAVALLLFAPPRPLHAQTLAEIPVTVAGASTGTAAGLRVRLQAADLPGLARVLGAPPPGPGAAYVETALPVAGLPLPPAAAPAALAPSFIVDYTEPEFAPLRSRLAAELDGRAADGADLVGFVARLVNPAYGVSVHTASGVARQRRGDCTEYALLTAALARSVGIPARIVHGAALLEDGGRWQAYGHAWVLMHEAGRWVVRDSALVGQSGRVYYIPTHVIDEEGPGFALAMVQASPRMLRHVEVLGEAAPAPAR